MLYYSLKYARKYCQTAFFDKNGCKGTFFFAYVQIILRFFLFYLHISKKCCTFAAEFEPEDGFDCLQPR